MADSTDGRERGIGWSYSVERWLELQETLPLRRVTTPPRIPTGDTNGTTLHTIRTGKEHQ